MVDLRLLAISKGFFVCRETDVRVRNNVKIEQVRGKRCGSAERGEEEGCLEGRGATEELDGEVFLCLFTVSAASWQEGGMCSAQSRLFPFQYP
jgi:hypothetical protein